MRIKQLNSITRIVGMLMILSIISSSAFASENNSSNQKPDTRFDLSGNVTEENFANIQTSILESISKQISELQSFYTIVSKASNASELQAVLLNHRQADECKGPGRIRRGPDGMKMGPGHMFMGPFVMKGLNPDVVANVTDENFTGVQTEILDSLKNMTGMLNNKLNNTEVSQDSNRTEEINKKIAELQNFSTEVRGASTAAELKEAVLTFIQTQAVDSIEKEIEHLQTKVSESENTSGNTTGLSSRITELTSLKEKISEAKSLGDLKTVMSTYCGIPELGDHAMPEREHGEARFHKEFPHTMWTPENAGTTSSNSTD